MARDRANIRLDMWADQDWRDLSEGAQHLYLLLTTHPTLSYAGVAEWRPGRLAAMTRGKTADDIRRDASELRLKCFVLADDESEEVLVRSFIKHDGLMKQPKLVVSMTNAYAAVASRQIREVIAFEVQKLQKREPGMGAWNVKQVETLLRAKGTDIRDLTPGFTPAFTPGAGQAQGLPTTTATTTATEASLPSPDESERSTRLPTNWVPTAAHYERAKKGNIDIAREVETFKLHAETNARRAANWNSAFTTWLIKARPSTQPKAAIRDWMNP